MVTEVFIEFLNILLIGNLSTTASTFTAGSFAASTVFLAATLAAPGVSASLAAPTI